MDLGYESGTEVTEEFQGWLAHDTLMMLAGVAALVLIVSAVVDWRTARRRLPLPFLWVFRAAAVGLVLYALSGPTEVTTSTKTTPRAVAVYLDASASMDTLDPEDTVAEWPVAAFSEPRHQLALGWLRKDLIPALIKHPDAPLVRWNAFGEQVVPTSDFDGLEALSGGGEVASIDRMGTDLRRVFSHAAQAAAGGDAEAVIVITDGARLPGESAVAAAEVMGGTPTYFLRIGNSTALRDVVVRQVVTAPAVASGDPVTVHGIVAATLCPGEETTVDLIAGGKVVDSAAVQFGSREAAARFTLEYPNAPVGWNELEIRARPLDGEFSEENNRAKTAVTVTTASDAIRVLLVDNLPRYEYRYLTNLLRRDSKFEHQEILFSSSVLATSEVLPFDRASWLAYDVVVLGDLLRSQLDREHITLLEDFIIEGGGTLVVIAGEQSMPQKFAGTALEDLLPVSEKTVPAGTRGAGFRVALSGEGEANTAMAVSGDSRENRRIWEGITTRLPLYDLSEYSVKKPAAHSLVDAYAADGTEEGLERTFLAWQDVGRGRVAYLAAPATYRLRFRVGDRYHYRFWAQFFRWATTRAAGEGSKTVRLSTVERAYSTGDEIPLALALADLAGKPLTGALDVGAEILDTAGGVVAQFPFSELPGSAGRYRTTITGLAEGRYTARVTGADVKRLLGSEGRLDPVQIELSVSASADHELQNTRSDVSYMLDLADASGGELLTPAELTEKLSNTNFTPSLNRTRTREPLWDRWLLFGLIAGLLSLEWGGRKLCGLV